MQLNRGAWSYAAIPLNYIFMLIIRTLLLFMFTPIFKAVGQRELL